MTKLRKWWVGRDSNPGPMPDLESEYLRQPAETTVRAAKLSEDQLHLAELAVIKLGEGWNRLVDAVDHWMRTGAKSLPGESPRIDDAVDQYLEWLAASDLRDATKGHWLRACQRRPAG